MKTRNTSELQRIGLAILESYPSAFSDDGEASAMLNSFTKKIEAFADTPANTLEDVSMKARVWKSLTDEASLERGSCTPVERLILGIIEDIESMTKFRRGC